MALKSELKTRSNQPANTTLASAPRGLPRPSFHALQRMKYLLALLLSVLAGCTTTKEKTYTTEYIQSAERRLAESTDEDSPTEEIENQAAFNSKLQESGSRYSTTPNSPNYVTKQAKLKEVVPPVFPSSIEDASLPVTVKLGCVVDARGKVSEIYVVESTDSRFNDAAIEALREWIFQPAESNGRKVPIGVFIPVVFDK